MTRTNLLAAALIASAGLMAGFLVLIPPARTVYGDMQASGTDYALMTARAADNGDDSVIVLQKQTGRLLTYQFRMDNGVARFMLVNPIDLSKLAKRP